MADEKARRTLNLTPDDAKPLIKIIQVSQVLSDNEAAPLRKASLFAGIQSLSAPGAGWP
jgi:hypothetical protein